MKNGKKRISISLDEDSEKKLDYLIELFNEESKSYGFPANFTKSLAFIRLINTVWNDTPAGKENAEKTKEKIKEYNQKFEGDGK